jgi:hypothetical protein
MDRLALRGAIAFIWLATGLGVLHPYYRDVGRAYLVDRLHLPEALMYLACVLEVILGLYILVAPPRRWLTLAQVALILFYTVVLAFAEPPLLVHPFGILSKNVPLAALIVTAQFVENEGWTFRARWTLLSGLAFIWVWEGLMVCVLAQPVALREVLAFTRLNEEQRRLLLIAAGVGQALGGVALLLLPDRWRRWLLALQALGLVIICVLVTWYDARLWFHPFGPITKNVPLLAGTLLAWCLEPPSSADTVVPHKS